MYHEDMRERHGTGRRYLQPDDHFRGGLGGAWSGASTPMQHDADLPRRGVGIFRPVDAGSDLWSNMSQQPQQGYEVARSEASSVPYHVGGTVKFTGYDGPELTAPEPDPRQRLKLFTAEGDDNSISNSNYNDGPLDGQSPQDLFGRTYGEGRTYNEGSNGGYPQEPSEAGQPKQRNAPSGRRYFGVGTNMQDMGTSAPMAERHGRGRAKFEEEDSQPIRQDQGSPMQLHPGQGRKTFHVNDSIKGEVLRPPEEFPAQAPPTNDDMKDAIKEWLEEVHGMIVVSDKWFKVDLKQHGSQWSIQAITQRGHSLKNEGATAKAIAEKLSMMQVSELIHFGVRFATKSEHEKILAGARHDPTYISGGVRGVLDGDRPGSQLSNNRRDPEDLRRRFISSGKDHFASTAVPHGDGIIAHQHVREHRYEDGLPRGIGHGKRYIGSRTQLSGGSLT